MYAYVIYASHLYVHETGNYFGRAWTLGRARRGKWNVEKRYLRYTSLGPIVFMPCHPVLVACTSTPTAESNAMIGIQTSSGPSATSIAAKGPKQSSCSDRQPSLAAAVKLDPTHYTGPFFFLGLMVRKKKNT